MNQGYKAHLYSTHSSHLERERFAAALIGAALLAGLLVLLQGCGSPRKEEPLLGEKQTPARVNGGEVVFMHTCYQCHPSGAAGLGPAINNKPLPRALIKEQVRNGGGAMPPFPRDRISDAELDQVVDYLQWLRSLHPQR